MLPKRRALPVALALLAGALLPAAASARGPAPCEDLPAPAGALCGSVEVPLDRAHPGAGTTTVAYVVVPHRDRSAPSAGTVLFNPGGPGASVIANAGDLAQLFAPLLESRDLLLVDPRGTGRSEALSCSAFAGIGVADLFAPHGRLVELTGACGRELGARGSLYGTAAVADDFEAVRAELGIPRLDLWGNSYGTYLMPVYAARHPQHVRSLVLSGAYPIDFDPWGRDRLAAARRGIASVCARSGQCRGDQVMRDLAGFAARLRHRPDVFTVAVNEQRFRARIDEESVAKLLYTGGNASQLGAIPALAASGAAGDLAPLRRMVETNQLITALSLTQPSADSLSQAFATQCHDYPRPYSPADPPAVRRSAYARALAALDPREFFPLSPAAWAHAGFEGSDACIEWPADPTAGSPIEPGTPLPDVPVLVLSGELDANTPSSAGREVARRFAHGTFVEIPNAGHVPTDYSSCAQELGMRFIATESADRQACAGTGEPPPVAPRVARRVGDLPPVTAAATAAQRRALAVVVATAGDLQTQAGLLGYFTPVRGLRGGWYARADDGFRLESVGMVAGATASGTLAFTQTGTEGALRLRGPAIPDGRLDVTLGWDGANRVTGTLGGRSVDVTFHS